FTHADVGLGLIVAHVDARHDSGELVAVLPPALVLEAELPARALVQALRRARAGEIRQQSDVKFLRVGGVNGKNGRHHGAGEPSEHFVLPMVSWPKRERGDLTP